MQQSILGFTGFLLDASFLYTSFLCCIPSQDAKKPQKAAVKRAVAAAEAKAAPEAEHPSKKAKVEPDGQLPVPDGLGL